MCARVCVHVSVCACVPLRIMNSTDSVLTVHMLTAQSSPPEVNT